MTVSEDPDPSDDFNPPVGSTRRDFVAFCFATSDLACETDDVVAVIDFDFVFDAGTKIRYMRCGDFDGN